MSSEVVVVVVVLVLVRYLIVANRQKLHRAATKTSTNHNASIATITCQAPILFSKFLSDIQFYICINLCDHSSTYKLRLIARCGGGKLAPLVVVSN